MVDRSWDRGPRWRRRLRAIVLALMAVVMLVAVPVLYVETQCVSRVPGALPQRTSLLPKADHREEINSYLTYPEWSIVHAYEDLAAVMKASSESDYDYFGAISRYWSSLCSITSLASARGIISTEYKVMLHVIGLSFAAEMGIKGAYEKTIGRVTSFIRGAAPSPEDRFAIAMAEDYAKFLRQTPWYEYPFGQKLAAFWRDTPMTGGSIFRKIERRIALTLEWAVKAVYAKVIGIGAAASPAPLRIKSVVDGLTPDDIVADPRIKVILSLGDKSIIETDRYRTFTEILTGLASRGRNLTEIAGNSRILVTVFSREAASPPPSGARQLFAVPVGSRPGWQRRALDVDVPRLTEFLRDLPKSGMELEHVYDY